MPRFNDQIANLIESVRDRDPELHRALELLNESMEALNDQINPIADTLRTIIEADKPVGLPTSFSYSMPGGSIRFIWTEVAGAARYELRKVIADGSLLDWDLASFVTRTSNLSADIDPIITGNYYFLLKSITPGGVESDSFSVLFVIVNPVGSPIITIQVIDNNVLIRWTEPPSPYFIDFYELFRDGVSIGFVVGNFTTYFESVAGTFTYSVTATDIAGDVSIPSATTVNVRVPPDYQFFSSLISALTGTRVNASKLTGPILAAPVNDTQTWQQHFSSHSWANIQAQISAGYPIYAQPTVSTGSYEEIIDYGALQLATIVNIIFTAIQADSDHPVIVVVKIASSTDGITYTSFVTGAVQFIASFRYIKFRLEFSCATDKGLILISNLTIRLDVKREMDSGSVTALSTDSGGTRVDFNKAFRDVESITLTTDAVQPITAIYDFADVPNPTHFFVYAFDSTGNRITYLVSWKARGIV